MVMLIAATIPLLIGVISILTTMKLFIFSTFIQFIDFYFKYYTNDWTSTRDYLYLLLLIDLKKRLNKISG
ncbi:hypothetical protein KHA80_22395 [Anaerobacillus sp. HL2]|nr:hypothetical protein KHA80_22395 [Anaerobacillus sp. HL2]